MLIVGSQGLRIIRPELLDREPADWDLVATFDEAQSFIRRNKATIMAAYPIDGGKKYLVRGDFSTKNKLPIEIEIAWPGSTAAALLSLVDDEWASCAPPTRTIEELGGLRVVIPTIDLLLALKISHRYLRNSPHFRKTMRDIKILRGFGASVDRYIDWIKIREKETYDYGHPKLNVSKSDFFAGDGVRYVYDHDAIHEAVNVMDRPAYEYYKVPGAEVICSRELFFAASEDVRLSGVAEEAYVLAIERSLVPHPGVLTPRAAFEKALMKVCSSITSGWFREYAWEHYDEVMARFDPTFWDRFMVAVRAGRVPPHKATQPR